MLKRHNLCHQLLSTYSFARHIRQVRHYNVHNAHASSAFASNSNICTLVRISFSDETQQEKEKITFEQRQVPDGFKSLTTQHKHAGRKHRGRLFGSTAVWSVTHTLSLGSVLYMYVRRPVHVHCSTHLLKLWWLNNCNHHFITSLRVKIQFDTCYTWVKAVEKRKWKNQMGDELIAVCIEICRRQAL